MFTSRPIICSPSWETEVGKSGGSSKAPDRAPGGAAGSRGHEPCAFGLCLNHTLRPPGSDPGETDHTTTFYMERAYQFRKNSSEFQSPEKVCGQHPQIPTICWHHWLVAPAQEGSQKPTLAPLGRHASVLSPGRWVRRLADELSHV